jgi:two-component sensor histidine kinase
VSADPCILYVDDDPGIALLVQRTAEAHGYTVETAGDGAAALERMRRGGIDLVALDHHMPGQTGLEVLPQIRALPSPPPVIYVTGAEDSRSAVDALKAGAVDYVWKDVQGEFRELLMGAIGDALEKEGLRRAKEAADHEMRLARERAELLLKEVNHRVANSLALVGSLARLQANAVADPGAKEALEEIQVRIGAIAGVHRRLYTSENVQVVQADAYLASLVEELQTSMNASGCDHPLRLTADPVGIPTDQAVALGMLVTELVTNAYKYAYPGCGPGEIRVRLTREDGEVLLAVEDDGIGWRGEGPARGSGLGMRIISAMAANLGSAVTFDAERPRGTRATLRFAA